MGRCGSLLALVALAAPGCRQAMYDQPRSEPFEGSAFFEDGRSARPQVPGTVARGRLREDGHLHAGLVDGAFAPSFPFEVTRAVLERGSDRYRIFCAPCHDAAGTGQGVIVARGMVRPASFDEPRLREAPPGYYFDVMTRGFGVMSDLADRVSAEDRWAIAAWIRVLQRARNASLEDVPPEERARLEGTR